MKSFVRIFIIGAFLLPTSFALAVGNISSTNYTAKLVDDDSSINFGYFTTNSSKNVTVESDELTGYIWGENIGWISLNCSNNNSCGTGESFVANDSNGNLSGHAWGENAGWINFGPFSNNNAEEVSIDGNGDFEGYAWSENFGWIQFDCDVVGACVNTTWRPSNPSGGGGNPINQLPIITILNPTSFNILIDSPASILFSALAADPDGSISNFSFFVNGTLITSVNNSGNLALSWTPPSDGFYQAIFSATDSSGATVSSSIINILIGGISSGGGGDTGDGGGDTDTGGGGDTDTGGGDTGDGGGDTDTGGGNDIPLDDGDGEVGDGDPFWNPLDDCDVETTILGVIICTIVETFDYTIDTFANAFEEMNFIISNSYGNIIVKIIGVVGILFGAIFTVLPRLFGTPLSFTEIGLLPYRLWSALMSAFGLKKRERPWGTVYDAITKQPLDPVIVTLQDLEGNEVQTSITDMDGRYGFLVSPGMYRLLPKKTHYTFPSLKLVGKTRDEIYLDLYFGYVFEVKGEGDVIVKNIPMDPVDFDWNEFAKRDQKLMKFYSKRDMFLTKLSDAFFSFGFMVSVLALITAPSGYNIFIFCLYLLLMILRETGLKIQNFGRVTDSQGNPLSFAIIKVFNADANVLISKKVANKYGQYYCLVQQGNYFVEIDQKIGENDYKTVFKSGILNGKKGYINENFKINLND